MKPVKGVAREYGDKWPLWVTEIGQPVSEVSEERQAELAEFAFRRLWEQGIPVIWYYYSDEPLAGTATAGMGWGLVRTDATPRLALHAVQDFISAHGR